MSTIPAWARKGAKVVCVVGSRRRGYSDYDCRCEFPTVGSVYTIRHVAVLDSVAGCWLEEIVNPTGDPDIGLCGETGFQLAGFRPVVTRTAEQDIAEHFSHLLTADAPEGVAA